MKKFRVTYELLGKVFFVQKRFLIFLWLNPKNRIAWCYSHQEVYQDMKNFPDKISGCNICELNLHMYTQEITYYDSPEDFLNKNSEYML